MFSLYELHGSQQHEVKFQDQVFTKFQDNVRTFFGHKNPTHSKGILFLEHKSFMNINNAVIALLERQFYTWKMQVSKT